MYKKEEVASIKSPPSLAEPDVISVSVETSSEDFIFEATGINSHFSIRKSPVEAYEFARAILREAHLSLGGDRGDTITI
jgi:hypothetical protein